MTRLLVCLALAAPAAVAQVADDAEARADAAVRRAGGQVLRDTERAGQPITHANFGDRRIADAVLTELAGLRHIRSLNLYATEITDAGLKHLAPLKSLTYLNLDKTKVTDAGLKDLAVLDGLVELSLEETAVTGAGLKELAGLKHLTQLQLEYAAITNAGLKGIAALTRLTALDLRHTTVTDDGVKELAPLTHLNYLSLPTITDRTLAELRALKLSHAMRQAVSHEGRNPKNVDDVGSLYLSGTRITDAAVKELVLFRNVKGMYLSATGLTDAGVAGLRRALPGCDVVR